MIVALMANAHLVLVKTGKVVVAEAGKGAGIKARARMADFVLLIPARKPAMLST